MLPVSDKAELAAIANECIVAMDICISANSAVNLIEQLTAESQQGKWQYARSVLWNFYFMMQGRVPLSIVGISCNEETFLNFLYLISNRLKINT